MSKNRRDRDRKRHAAHAREPVQTATSRESSAFARRTARTVRWLGVSVVLLLAGSCADTKRLDPGPDPESSCEAYVRALDHCLSVSVGSAHIVQQRVLTTRQGLESAIRAAVTDKAREALTTQCDTGTKQLSAACQ
jgi:hypothetical protein